MNRPQPNATPRDALDTLLEQHFNASTTQLTPSSGFVLSVMDAVHQQSTAPPPIAFPWRRILPGVIAILCAFVAFFLYIRTHPITGALIPTNLHLRPHADMLASNSLGITLGGTALAICLTLAVTALSFRLAGRSR
jgi:hypothetical protein